ncbi:MAG TPA: hypothetical protein VEP90_03510 [Methylomirabilota bacterium]|nr:hypothetical protein [Methylomirabilota bacterium]
MATKYIEDVFIDYVLQYVHGLVKLSIVVFQTILELALSLIFYLCKNWCCYIAVDVLLVAKALQLPSNTTFPGHKLRLVLKRLDLGRNRHAVFFEGRYGESEK